MCCSFFFASLTSTWKPVMHWSGSKFPLLRHLMWEEKKTLSMAECARASVRQESRSL